MKLRLLFAVAIVVIGSIPCETKVGEVSPFSKKTSSLHEKAFIASEKVNDYLSSGVKSFQDFAKSDLAGELATLVLEMTKISSLRDPGIGYIQPDLKLIQETFDAMKSEAKDSHVDSLCTRLTQIVDVCSGAYAGIERLSILLSLAPIAAIVAKHMQILGNEEGVACKFATTIEQYFVPFLLDRFIDINIEGAKENKWDYFMAAHFMRGFSIDYDTSKANLKKVGYADAKIIDKYLPNGSIQIGGYSEVVNYIDEVRRVTKNYFLRALNAVKETCTKPRKPTGSGWLNIFIGGASIPKDEKCDLGIPEKTDMWKCDSYVEIVVNDKSVFKTLEMKNTNGIIQIHEFYNQKMNKADSSFTIRLMDTELIKDAKLASQDFRISDDGMLRIVEEKERKVYFGAYWMDETK